MEIIEQAQWYFPPTKNKYGKARDEYDIKDICIVSTDFISAH